MKLLKNMEKANKESFGDKKLGCCGLDFNQRKNSKSNKIKNKTP